MRFEHIQRINEIHCNMEDRFYPDAILKVRRLMHHPNYFRRKQLAPMYRHIESVLLEKLEYSKTFTEVNDVT